MSRKGNKLIKIPAGSSISANNGIVNVKGTLGSLNVAYPDNLITVEQIGDSVKVSRANDEKQTKMYHGTVNSNINNALIGVSAGYTIKLKIVGVGYKAAVKGNTLDLAIGFSHPVVKQIPAGLKVTTPTPTEIIMNGSDKIVIGQFAAEVRAIRKPEPYNGKGIMYSDEIIVRKVGKTAEGAAGPAAPKAKK